MSLLLFVRFGGTPASRYWPRVLVVPARARSKSFAARSSAAGGRSEADRGGVVEGCSVDVDGCGGAGSSVALGIPIVGALDIMCECLLGMLDNLSCFEANILCGNRIDSQYHRTGTSWIQR